MVAYRTVESCDRLYGLVERSKFLRNDNDESHLSRHDTQVLFIMAIDRTVL